MADRQRSIPRLARRSTRRVLLAEYNVTLYGQGHQLYSVTLY
jgi:hypothetical protein